MKKALVLLFFSIALVIKSMAYTPPIEGMWLPMFVDRLNYAEMKEMGLQLTPEELYDVNNASLKDAIVGLASGSAPEGFFCTGEVISPNGLILTNHHCAYGNIQEHSCVDNDYLDQGFWALSLEEELPNEGLTASFLVRMDDVTQEVMDFFEAGMTEVERSSAIREAREALSREHSEDGKYDVTVKSFFEGNEFYMFTYITYKDVRLVGAPPSSVGKFGGDTDNWMWPRHTGDFAMYRVYTAPDGTPATYSQDNIPMKPKHHLPISIKGIEKGDFSMIWGFPGGTQRYLTSHGVQQSIEQSSPIVVEVRDEKLSIMREEMDKDRALDIMYSAKYSRSANGWKYFKGQIRGLKNLDVYSQKKELEEEFEQWANEHEQRKEKYGEALDLIQEGYQITNQIVEPLKYMEEAIFQGGEFIMPAFSYFTLYGRLQSYHEQDKVGWKFWKMFQESALDTSVINPMIRSHKAELDDQYDNYDTEMDRKVFTALLELFYEQVDEEFYPEILHSIDSDYGGNVKAFVDNIYENSLFVSKERLEDFLNDPQYEKIQDDPGLMFTASAISKLRELYAQQRSGQNKISQGKRLFVAGLREMNPDKSYYPNANSTLRLTYGTVEDYYPRDAVHYDYYTTLEGVMEKKDPTHREFRVHEKLVELYENKDYGRYGTEDGRMVVGFITDHDITGGNSGSPVINAKGHLIGCAFDGNWEAMSGDIAFEPELQRTISVDARYILFITEKLGGATNLIEEMTIIE